MDGQVAASLSFEDWLRGRDEAFQDELLGKKVADLWRAGDLALPQLTDRLNQPISVDALVAKYG